MNTITCHRILDTFTGQFFIAIDDASIMYTGWLTLTTEHDLSSSREDGSILPSIADRLNAYFAGEPVSFGDVPVSGGDSFFGRAWRACRDIPLGETCTYGELASRAGSPAAARAAGQAMRTNNMPIIVPCHRVVAAGGVLHGFSGSTDPSSDPLTVKAMLLAHEAKMAGIDQFQKNIPNLSFRLLETAV